MRRTLPIRNLLMYGLSLGLLLAAVQTAQYRFLFADQHTEIYLGLMALLFTLVGIWAGLRWQKKTAEKVEPLSGPDLEKRLEGLNITPREYEVLQWIAQGLSNQEIADRMYVSLNTVKTHTSNLFSKLDAQRRTQAVQKARALGLLAPPPKV